MASLDIPTVDTSTGMATTIMVDMTLDTMPATPKVEAKVERAKVEVMVTAIPMPVMEAMTLDTVEDTKTMANPVRDRRPVVAMDTAIPMVDTETTTLDMVVDTKTTASPARAKVEVMDTAIPTPVMETMTLDTAATKGLASPARDPGLEEEVGDLASPARDPGPEEEAGDLASPVRDHLEEAGVDMATQVHMETTMVTPMDHTVH